MNLSNSYHCCNAICMGIVKDYMEMKRLRCCVLTDKTKYRGIDREVTMLIFNREKEEQA